MQPQPLYPQPIFAEYWVIDFSVGELIRNMPENFDIRLHVYPFVTLVIDGWLTDLIGVDEVNRLQSVFSGSQPYTATDTQLLDIIRPFIIYAAWSQYWLQSNIIVTDTGPVTKLTDGFQPIGNQQRTEVSRFYKVEAERWALRLSKYLSNINGSCSTTIGSGRPLMRSSSGSRKSRFS